ncbi:hypothetical protein C3F09_01190 [candidate division GN15 bacterium]|uniref:Tetratricopeptide repeat protein n=1 Tax=candidate division GN15 bacterium TaxID=2072418 RepID=A0A855X4A5_9BACT|nr:MAG: hypothetical protein C3F09_01190 [candidate division GN15 bacterium]
MGKKKATTPPGNFPQLERRVLFAYYLTLAAFFVASFFPQARLWGINWWAYYPLWVKLALLAGGALIPLSIRKWSRRWSDPDSDISNRSYWLFSGCLLIGFGLIFYLLRAKTHFLGDGYQLLSTLSSEQFYIKFRNRGSVGLQHFIMQLLGGRSEANALLSYQITSISAGLLFPAVVMTGARKLFQKNTLRLPLLFGLSTGGYTLLFFGYVENYALFVDAVLIYCLVGLLVTQGKLNRWWILLAQAAAVFFHVFGSVLVPASVFLLLSDTGLSNRLGRLSSPLKWAAAAIAIAIVGVAFYYFYTTNYFFRFSLVSLVSDQFTVDGYTLFSINHILDLLNLTVMLVPGIAVLAVAGSWRQPSFVSDHGVRFLVITAVCAMGAAFIFDPHLGMPRDWDLFAFSGVPLAVLLIRMTVSDRGRRYSIGSVILPASALALLLLLTRAGVQMDENASLAMTENYISLDNGKTNTARFLVIDYYTRTGRPELGDSARVRWQRDIALNDEYMSAVSLAESGKARQALPILKAIVKIRPNFHEAWSYLGRCMGETGNYDSAFICISISNGFNPYNKQNLYHLGLLYFRLKKYDLALQSFRFSSEIDTLYSPPLMGMVLSLKELRDTAAYISLLKQITQRPMPNMEFYQEYIDYLGTSGKLDEAAQAIREGISKGLDSTYARETLTKYPGIKLR